MALAVYDGALALGITAPQHEHHSLRLAIDEFDDPVGKGLPALALVRRGTPAIAEVIGLGAAVTYLESVGLEDIHDHELKLAKLYKEKLTAALGSKITVYGPKVPEAGILAFTIEGLHPHDIASILND